MSEKRKEVRYIAQKFANAILSDASSYIISTDGLQALNAFLDELLFILIDTAKGLETSRIKAAVYQTFPTALGKNAIVEAELEAKSYLDMGGKDTSNHLTNQNGISGTSAMFNQDSDETRVEQVFEQFRAKCQYYSKLGERLGSPAGNPSSNGVVVVPTLIAIYVTAVLEHVAEYVLQVASQIADRQDHADMVTVREVYVALLEDRQIESIFEIMILKSQLQKRFRNSLIMPGTGSKPEDQTPATVKRSGSWGKQLRLGNADKPKLDVQLPTDIEDDVAIDPNRPQFGDWDEPPDEENKQKKKNDFEMLFSSGETMKVSLTPNRLRTIEVHKKTAGGMGAVASRSSSRAASVLGGKDGAKSHGRRPSHGDKGAATGGPSGRKGSHAGTSGANDPSNVPPKMPAIPASFGVSQPILKKQAQTVQAAAAAGASPQDPPMSPMQQMQLRQQQQGRPTAQHHHQQQEFHGLGIAGSDKHLQQQQHPSMERTSTSTFGSNMTLSTASGANSSITSPPSPNQSRSPTSPTGSSRHGDGSLKATTQATNDLVHFLGNTSPSPSFSEKTSTEQQPPSPATMSFDTTGGKKENPIKSFMGRLGRNSMQRTSMDSNNGSTASNVSHNSSSNSNHNAPAPISTTPTSPRSFTITGQPQQQMSPVSLNSSYYSDLQQYGQQTTTPNNRGMQQQQQHQQQQQQQHQGHIPQNNRDLAGFPMPPAHGQHHSNNSSAPTPPPLNMHGMSMNGNGQHSPVSSPVHNQRPMSPADPNGFPIPSRTASLNHDISSPTKPAFAGTIHTGAANANFESRTGLEAGLPRPLSPRPVSPRPASPGLRPSSPRPSSPLQNNSTPHHHQLRNNQLDGQPPVPGSILAPSPLSNSISSHTRITTNGSDISPGSSSTSLIMYGKVSHMQERLHKTAQAPVPGFKPHEHLLNQNNPNRISLEGTIRANPFYQQDRSSSVRSSLADLSSSGGDSPKNSSPIKAEGLKVKETTTPIQEQEEETTIHDLLVAASSSSSDAGSEDEEARQTGKKQMLSPATSPEMDSGFKDRLPSATTRTLTAAAAASKQQLQQQQQQQLQMVTPPSSDNQRFERDSIVVKEKQMPATVAAAAPQEDEVVKAQGEEEEDSEVEVTYVTPVMRAPSTTNGAANRHSIFVDEAAQAMDRLSRQRHRQSMRLENEDGDYESDEEEDDEDYEYDEDDMTQGIAPPEKWHYSDLEDSEDEDEDEEDEEDDEDGSNRRRKHESFMSAKSVLMPYSSTVSLVDNLNNDTQDEDDDEEEEIKDAKKMKRRTVTESMVEGLAVQRHESLSEESLRQLEQQDPLAAEITPADLVKGDEYVDLVSAAASTAAYDDEEADGVDADADEDEDETEDSDDLEDNDDEEGQDRRIYLQQLRIQKREARRLERLANPTQSKKLGRNKSKEIPALSEVASAESQPATTETGVTKKKTLRKGHSKENLRRQQDDRPQTPTTPVPTTQIIPLTPTDFVLIRQKLFAAGNFEASMRMLDTIFHAAMAKMVEGRERGVQTDPVSFLNAEENQESKAGVGASSVVVAGEVDGQTAKEIKRSSTSTSTSTAMDADEPQQPLKQLQWVTVTAEKTKEVVVADDDDDEDRVVEWLLGGV
ncbi:hypothetical protein EMPS_06610 [Entomortierella parvispora]|uniref:Uncharacterized protein n=1 Tax=Entomortierella parvispora TaxID=205924 RepID=A0A9P3HDA6_9FUNG|nr:hypothetical protein EMPS_06610 [Entomortierella parvispora]